jgi:hypothetical protein
MADQNNDHPEVEVPEEAVAKPGAGIRLLSRLMYVQKQQQPEDGADKQDEESFVLPFLWPLW